MSRGTGGGLARLIIRNRGRKGVKDAALAEECGFAVEEMYRCLGPKLLSLPRSGWFELEPETRNSDQEPALPTFVFTLSGVAAITAWLDTPLSQEVGLALVHLLSTRRRASKNKQRRPRRANDPARQAKYESAAARLQAARSDRYQRSFARLQTAWRKLQTKLKAELKTALDLRSRRGISARTGRVPSGSPVRSRNRKSRDP